MASSTLTGPIRIAQINRTYYVGEAFLSTIQKAVTFAVGTGYPGDVIVPVEYAGSDSITAVTGGASNVYIMDERAGAHDLYAWNGTAYALQPLTAATAEFESCIVDDSPVRTFANTPDGPGEGMVWPDIGIPVSQGSTWQSPSIDPNTVAFVNEANNFTQPQTVSGITTTVPPMTQSAVSLRVGNASGELVPSISFINQSAPVDNHYADVVLYQGGMQFRFANDNDSVVTPWLTCNRNGGTPTNAVFGCAVHGTGDFVAYGPDSAPTIDLSKSNVAMRSGQAPNAPVISFVNTDAAANSRYSDIVAYPGGIQIRASSDDLTTTTEWISFNRTGSTADHIYIYCDTTLTGTFSVNGTKNFRIRHPSKDNMLLTHSSLEGPEAAVFYRGEGETMDGVATITLPDYFESLTRPEGRTVQITELFDDSDNPSFGNFFAAGRVRDGMFQVRCNQREAKFYWEVKAIRADVDELEVETEWPEDDKSIAR